MSGDYEILNGMIALGKPCADGYEFNGFHIHPDFLQEAKAFPYFDGIAYDGFVKIVQGTCDQYVSQASLHRYKACFKNCDCIDVIGADHCYSTLEHTQHVRKEIVTFYGKIKNLAIEKQ